MNTRITFKNNLLSPNFVIEFFSIAVYQFIFAAFWRMRAYHSIF